MDILTILITVIVTYILGLFTEEFLGPRPRLALGRIKRQIGRLIHDDPVAVILQVRLDPKSAISEEEAEKKIVSALGTAGLRDYARQGDGVSGSVQQARTRLQYRIHMIHVIPEEVEDPLQSEQEVNLLFVDSFRLVIESQITYRRFNDILADLNTVMERLANAFAQEQIISDLKSKTFSIDITTLPELGGFFALLQATSFTARVRDSGTAIALRDKRLDIEGPLDSTTLRIVRDAILFGF